MAAERASGDRRARWASAIELAGLALLSYVPFLLSSPGRVSADSKQYLYLDVGRFLSRAPYLWDSQMGAGTVSHQHLGYLFPMGPWFWVLERLGVEVWVAQRLWLGTLTLAAGLGTRWLLRHLGLGQLGALAAALVYMLTPYQLAFTARASVLLLPWAGLPWLIGLADRAVKRGGWREPAWFALVVLAIGAVNASSLLLVGIGPVVWVAATAMHGRVDARRALAAVGRIGVLGLGVSLWWVAALRLEAAYGLPVLQVTERLETVAATSSPLDVLRGLGNWFFYGRDRLGYSIDQAGDYLTDAPTVLFSFAVPVLGLASAIAVRWPQRARFVLLVLAGTVVSVGAWPLSDPSPFASAVGTFTEDTSAGLALRNTARAAPLVVLGFAGLIGAAVSAWRPQPLRLASTALVGAVALGALWPVVSTGFLSDNMDRVDPLPQHWYDVAAALDAEGDETRVLELPGSNFGAHRWGHTVDPILPGLMERPHVAREVLPLGSVGSALLVDALDRRLQEGWLDLDAVAPVARLLGAGTVVLRTDLQYERFLTPRPDLLWDLFTGSDVPGLDEPVGFGDPVPNIPVPGLPMVDELALRSRRTDELPPPVATFDVEDAAPIVRVAPTAGPILLGGDADGIVDAASAAIVDGRALVLQVASLNDRDLAAALEAGADLVLTDSNRRRIQTWFYAIRDTRGPTERAGETLNEPTGYDHRLEPFPGAGDDSRTVVEQVGGTVTASLGGGAPRPEDRAAAAVDGDPRTSWRVGGADPTGSWLRIELDEPVRADRIALVQPQDGPRDRIITEIRLTLDGDDAIDVELGPGSLTPEGQVVRFDAREVTSAEIEVTGTTDPPFDPARANAVGFAELSLGSQRIEEVVRPPLDLLARTNGGIGHRLDVVLTRLRYEPGEPGRQDQELTLRRSLDIPAARSFGLTGTARVNPNAADELLDEILGTDIGGASVRSSGHLPGDLGSRASRALDGDSRTSWQSGFGPSEQRFVAVDLAAPALLGAITVELVADARHSLPARLSLDTGAGVVDTLDVPEAPDGALSVSVTFPAIDVPVSGLRVVVDAVRPRTAIEGDLNPAAQLPVAIAEISADGLPQAVDAERVPETCRQILAIDGRPVPLRASGLVADARRGLALEGCAGPHVVRLEDGRYELSSIAGLDGGIDVDQIVLSSAADGSAATPGARGEPRVGAGSSIEALDQRPTSADITVATDGEPFWLVLGQSLNEGWELTVDGATAGERRLVDGYANGWLIEPDSAGTLDIQLVWGPQRLVWITLAVSAAAVVACVALIVAGRRHRRALDRSSEDAAPAWTLPLPDGSDLGPQALPWLPVAAVGAGALGWLVATPAAALVAAGVVLLGALVPQSRWVWLVAAPFAVVAARQLDEPLLAWLALSVVGGDQLVRWLRDRPPRLRPRVAEGADRPPPGPAA